MNLANTFSAKRPSSGHAGTHPRAIIPPLPRSFIARVPACEANRDAHWVGPAVAGPQTGTRRSSAFSLVELLVVVSIIAVLLGLVLPAAIALRQAAKRKEAAVQARTLVHAVTAYKTAYGKWPAQTQGDNDTTHANSALVIAALTTDTALNPRQLRFMEIPPAGLLNGCYVDPWKRSFVVAMDENGDGNVEIDLSTFEPLGTGVTVTVSNQTVAVASGGPDPAQESKRIYSWKP